MAKLDLNILRWKDTRTVLLAVDWDAGVVILHVDKGPYVVSYYHIEIRGQKQLNPSHFAAETYIDAENLASLIIEGLSE